MRSTKAPITPKIQFPTFEKTCIISTKVQSPVLPHAFDMPCIRGPTSLVKQIFPGSLQIFDANPADGANIIASRTTLMVSLRNIISMFGLLYFELRVQREKHLRLRVMHQ